MNTNKPKLPLLWRDSAFLSPAATSQQGLSFGISSLSVPGLVPITAKLTKMSKRVNDSGRRVVVRGMGASVSADTVQSLFSQFGHIEFVRFLAYRTCFVQFEAVEAAVKALKLNDSRQAPLGALALTVLLDPQDLPSKKTRSSPSNFYLVDPPKHNNYLIPTLENFITKSTSA